MHRVVVPRKICKNQRTKAKAGEEPLEIISPNNPVKSKQSLMFQGSFGPYSHTIGFPFAQSPNIITSEIML